MVVGPSERVPRGSLRRRGRGVSAAIVTAAVAVALLPATATAEPGFGSGVVLPTDAGPIVAGVAPYSAISCPAVGSCAVAGPLASGVVGTNPTVLNQTDGEWGFATALVMPANADETVGEQGGDVDDLDCWAPGDCVAVGDYNYAFPFSIAGGSGEVPLAEPMVDLETDGAWAPATEVPLTQPTDDFVNGTVVSVSCDDEGDCTAVGYESTQSMDSGVDTFGGFVITEASGSGTWSAPAPLPVPAGSYDYVLPTAVSCTDADDCTVTEFADAISGPAPKYGTDVVVESSGVWGTPVLLTSATGHPLRLTSLSCPASGSCVAGGASTPTTLDLEESVDESPAVAVETDGTWAPAVDLPAPVLSPATVGGEVDAVTCAAVDTCLAVGARVTADGDDVPMAASFEGRWSYVALDNVPVSLGASDATSGSFTGAACVSASACLAVGAASTGPASSGAYQFGVVDPVSLTTVVKPPRPPFDLAVRQSGGRVYVSFAAPRNDGGAKISSFLVRASARGERARTCHTPSLACYFTGAVPGHAYRVTVVATNVAGTSPASLGVTFVAARAPVRRGA